MSDEAIAWALEWAPVPSHMLGTLLGIAIYADEDGCGSAPGQETIAWYARKSSRQVRNDLACLEHDLKLISRGDQSLVAHLAADERPVVWNLALDRRRDQRPTRERKSTSGPWAEGAEVHFRSMGGGSGSPLPRQRAEGPEVHFRPDEANGSGLPAETEGAEAHFRANGGGAGSGLPTKKRKKTSSSSSSPIVRIADALDVDEDEARDIYSRIASDPNVRAPSRYISSLIDSGDITKFRAPKPAAPAATPPIETHPFDDDGAGWCRTCRLPQKHARHGGTR